VRDFLKINIDQKKLIPKEIKLLEQKDKVLRNKIELRIYL
jgi:hypothetical protein